MKIKNCLSTMLSNSVKSIQIKSMLGVTLAALLAYPVSAAEAPTKAEVKMQAQAKADAKSAVAEVLTVNINTASVEELQELKGIGAAKAQAIVDYRTQNGKFNAIDDLANVSGIGAKLIEQNRHLIKL
ncbi:competence protein ComEA helix-hairpin-helix repeat protein [Shewanella sp. W3-18-1]|uniref:ComEA family DNA-binding protein n=1 Tax=Shewanella sp. (strain W3-18-1) TaxID=351745 RepID=UPI00005FC256|nr:ComEA family DNA-binding protein [Shewanella sp. W3-18-1]ABM25416.1 competence protein ComEA helix-hairpin-helix repeat protein [Shewanella sp. W3-18-1]